MNEVLELLKKQFGVEDVYFSFKIMGKGRVYAYRECDFEVYEYHSGVYFGKIERDGLRLSIEGCYLIGERIKKGVVELSREEMLRWLRGEDIEREVHGYVVLKWRNYWLGCGKGNGKKIKNFIPKDRRIDSHVSDDSDE